jgi:hypothetical protein
MGVPRTLRVLLGGWRGKRLFGCPVDDDCDGPLRSLIYAFVATGLLSGLATACDAQKPKLYTEPHSRACLTALTSHGGTYEHQFNADATHGSVRLAFRRLSRTSDLQVDLNFMINEEAAKKVVPKSGGWHHPDPDIGVEFARRGNVIEFWHQGIAKGPAPTSYQQEAVDSCLS